MKDMRGHRLEAVVGRLYEAAMEPSLWRTVLHEVSDALGAESAALFGRPLSANNGIYFSPGADSAFDWLAREGKELHNPRPERAMRYRSRRRVLTESDLFTEWELEKIPFNAALAKLGFRWEAGGVFAEIDGMPLFFTAQRHADHEGFGKLELEAMEALFPHLERAAQISSRLSLARTDGMLDAFEQMACGGVLIDQHGCVIRMNHRAEAMVGRILRIKGRRLTALYVPADAALQRLVGSVVANGLRLNRHPGFASTPLQHPSSSPLAVYAMPLLGKANDVFRRARAILVIVDPYARRDIHSLLIAQTYNLTTAELRLALALARGKDLREISEEHGVSHHTTRVQLKALMAKTDTHRQSELVALMAGFALVPAPPRGE